MSGLDEAFRTRPCEVGQHEICPNPAVCECTCHRNAEVPASTGTVGPTHEGASFDGSDTAR